MRLLKLSVFSVLVWIAALGCCAFATAEDPFVTPFLTRLPGVNLIVYAKGDKPCDYVASQLATSGAFVLNAGNMPVNVLADTSDSYERGWPAFIIQADSLRALDGCVWTVTTTVIAKVSSGEALGGPFSQPAIVWQRTAFGTSPGNGLTAYVATYVEQQTKAFINDIHEAKRTMSAQ